MLRMTTEPFFPFIQHAYDLHYVVSPKLAERCWLRDRHSINQKLTWYGVDMLVKSATEITVFVRSMANSFHGGLGPVIFEYDPVLSKQNLLELASVIKKRQLEWAEAELERREEAARIAAVEAVRFELFG